MYDPKVNGIRLDLIGRVGGDGADRKKFCEPSERVIDGVFEVSDDERQMVELLAQFTDEQVKPVVAELEHANTYPEQLIDTMKSMGVYGLLIDEEHGGVGVSMLAFAMATEQLARGWMSLAGAMGGHSVVSYLISEFGTAQQQQKYLPGMATGELRATMALTEPGGGSDLQAMRTHAAATSDGFLINGTKTWISNARHAGVMALLCKTDPQAEPAHAGISILLVEPGHGYSCSKDLTKLGYKGVEACEVNFSDVAVGADAVLGGETGMGFAQMMRGLEVGRIQVAARSLGVGQAALDDATVYAQQREAFGKPIWKHQSVGNLLADMATSMSAARLLTHDAAQRFDSGSRSDLEAGMAKLFASEATLKIATDAMRIHGGYGYSTEYDIERYFRDAPLMIVGEGTNEIQRNVIAGQYIARHRIEGSDNA